MIKTLAGRTKSANQTTLNKSEIRRTIILRMISKGRGSELIKHVRN